MSSRSWWDRWGKKVAGGACFAGAALLAPVSAPAAIAAGVACGLAFGNDEHVKAAGGALGAGIAAVVSAVRGGGSAKK